MTADQPSMQNPRRQNVRDFTVQIRHASTDAIAGTGFVVSNQGHIVTCAHVVKKAGIHPAVHKPKLGIGKHRDAAAGGAALQGMEVGVYFPQVTSGEAKARRAVVTKCFPQHDDDVVLLQLLGGPAPLSPDQIAVLGRAEPSELHPFRSYGYRRLSDYDAGLADGMIQGPVEAPHNRDVQVEPIQLHCDQIDQGMSGAAVLDMDEKRNLVVGVISEVYYPRSMKDPYTCWAVNARVLSLEPLNLPLQDEPYTSRPSPQPRTDIAAAQAATNPRPNLLELHGAPPSLTESRWAGRVDSLQALNADWTDPACHVSELIGFGGEGKSSLARHWLDLLLADPTQPQPDGVFWWNCYDNRSVDALLEAALQYLSGGSIDPRRLTSSNIRAQVIGAMLGARRYLFILDGLEVLQHQEGDAYGLLLNPDLRELLGYFAAPGHNSFCLLTGRAPLFDLVNYTTFRHHDVDRLSPHDGRDLLLKLGVHGPDVTLDRVVTEWDGHALTLSLLGGYLVERYEGDVTHISDLPVPTANEPRYERVQRVLRRYDIHLSEAERAFLLIFSVFRLPVHQSALTPVFRTKSEDAASALTTPLAALNDPDFNALLNRLRAYHLLNYDAQPQRYTTHPLIRAYYAARLSERERSQVQAVYARIKDYYLTIIGDISLYPTLNDLVPLIEVVHYACCAGAYEEAYTILRTSIDQYNRMVLTVQLSAYETALALMQDFFLGSDTSQEPLVDRHGAKSFILNRIGFCLTNLGHPGKAVNFYERGIAIDLGMENWQSASADYFNLAGIYVHLGAFSGSVDAVGEALALARQAQDKTYELYSLAFQAWVSHLLGNLGAASTTFQKAEALQKEIDPNNQYLYSHRGIYYADHLRRVGNVNYARQIIEANLENWVSYSKWLTDESLCHRALGDLDADAGLHQTAQWHYSEALRVARSTARWVLIEALLAQGRFAARQGDGETARTHLEEAIGYAVTGGYRLYEVDITIALAWAYRAMGDAATARAQAERALRLSTEMEYYWGQVDAKEVLAALDGDGS